MLLAVVDGADCGIGIAILPVHVALMLALDDMPAGAVDHWTMLMTYTVDSRRHLAPSVGLKSSDRNSKLLILYGMEF